MSSWDEVAAYYQGLAHDPRYAAFGRDMVSAVETLRGDPTLAQFPREVIGGMIVIGLPAATRCPALGWFKPGVYSAVSRDDAGKLYDAQIVTLNGVIGVMQMLTKRLTADPRSTSLVSR